MMVVSFEGEMMIGNLALALFSSSKKDKRSQLQKTHLMAFSRCSLSLRGKKKRGRILNLLGFRVVSS